jgi:hypothetical protein
MHFIHVESELKQPYTDIITEYFNTLFLFCYVYIPPRTACVGHSIVRPVKGKILPNFISGI